MCGRFALYSSAKEIKRKYNTVNKIDLEPRYNITPLSYIPIIIEIDNERIIKEMRWGLIPSWSKTDEYAASMINARAESILEKPSFSKSFKTRRCIIPASGFYEWTKDEKQPYYIKPKDSLFSLAAIWDKWENPQGKVINTCSIITTDANISLKDIHSRMPVILEDSQIDSWLNREEDLSTIRSMLNPYSDEKIEFYKVDKKVNKPSNNDESVIDPTND